jgi:hypothetical protein
MLACLLVMLCIAGALCRTASAQEAVRIPAFRPSQQATAQEFQFVSDGPRGPGWTRPDEIARVYVHALLPLFFERSIELKAPLAEDASLDWIFTGPHAGFTVTVSPTSVRLMERYYDSVGLSDASSNYPSRVVLDESRAYTGATARSVTVISNDHLAVKVLVNGVEVLTAHCTFDVTRHQLMLHAPRAVHEVVEGRLLQSSSDAVTISVDPVAKHQTMLGFGGSPSVPAYMELSAEGKRRYWEIMREYNLLLDREYPMGSELKPDLSNLADLQDATPHYYGDNFPNGEVSSAEYSKHVIDMGGGVIYELWALPKWATKTWQAPAGEQIFDAWRQPVRSAADPQEYARIMVGYCKWLKEHAGAAPLVLGIENEVEQPPDVFAQMTILLRKKLDEAGFQSTKIHMADAPYVFMAVDRIAALKKDATAWAATDDTASHQYDYQRVLANPDLYDEQLQALHDAGGTKPFLATEICLNDPQAQEPSYRLAFQVGQLYDKDLTIADAEALMYCWLILDVEQPTFGGSRSLLVPSRTEGDVPVASSFQLRVLGAWSRHIDRGMQRVDSGASDPDVMTTAFAGGNQATMVIMNRSTQAKTVQVKWTGVAWKSMERTSAYLVNAPEALPKGESLTVQPGEIVTLSTEAER